MKPSASIVDHQLIKTKLLMLCLFYALTYTSVEAGKGKVPVYMPIPIPVPMPVPSGGGGGGGGGKFSSQHNHQHHETGSEIGDVKKIYLLQPISKGNNNQHFNQQQPEQQQYHHQQQQQQQQQQHNVEQLSHSLSKGHGSSDVKILPIVVIPPMAPMPPIQLHQPSSQIESNSVVHIPRMTLSPQFNNYMVSSIAESKRAHPNNRYNQVLEYGGSGGGQLFKREGPRLRHRSAILYPAQSGSRLIGIETYQQPRTRIRFHEENLNNNNNDFNESPYRSSSARNGFQRFQTPMNQRRRQWRNDNFAESSSTSGRYRPIVGSSIRDIMEAQQQPQQQQQQSEQGMFDDEPNNGYSSDSLPIDSNAGSESKRVHQKSHDPDLANSEQSQLTRDNSIDKDYIDSSPTREVYLDRDYHNETPSKLSIKYLPINPNLGRRLYLDEREILNDEDEWRFDSIKSVSHVSPTSNSTTTVNNATNQTVTPPIMETTVRPQHQFNSQKSN